VDPVTIESEMPTIDNTNDFAQIRLRKARRRCPDHLTLAWAQLVKTFTKKVVSASNMAEREVAMTQLLILPNIFLPANLALRTIDRHLHLQTAPPEKQRSPADRTDDEIKRLSRHIENLAADYQIRTAMKCVQSDGIVNATLQEIAIKIKAKFVEKSPDEAQGHAENEAETSPSLPASSLFGSSTIQNAIARQSKQAATAVDGWTRALILQATQYDASIIDDLDVICSLICRNELGKAMHYIRMGRAVAIPKNDTDIRPIIMSSIFAKIAGTAAMITAGIKTTPYQYALTHPNGAQRIYHKVARLHANGKAVWRFDLTNAFNEVKRSDVRRILKHDALRNYFDAICAPTADIAVFGRENDHILIPFEEGLRQGDAVSCFFFCTILDEALKIIGARHPMVFAFVDDITLAVDPKDLDDAYATVAEAVRHVRLRLNEAKCRSSTPGSLNNETFPILGGDLHETSSFVDSYLKKMDRWFGRLARVQVHPALHFTLLRISGSAKIRYVTQILKPEYVRPIAVRFNELVYATLENILGVRPTPPAVHDVHGAGIPDYASNLHNLYDTSKREAETGFITHLPKLVTNCFEDKAAGENDVQDLERPTGDPHQGDYLFYKHGAINPAHFVTALALRLGCLPPSMQWCTPTTCACGSFIKDVRQV
jgi:hypothetical protein